MEEDFLSFCPEDYFIDKKESICRKIKILILTGNSYKEEEFIRSLGINYGCKLHFAGLNKNIGDILKDLDFSPHYILREESCLTNILNSKNKPEEILNFNEIIKTPETIPKFINNKSTLIVFKTIWSTNKENIKYLENLEKSIYTSEIQGYIDLNKNKNSNVFGWDSVFIHGSTGISVEDFKELGFDKISPRQSCLSSFIKDFILYKTPKTLIYNKLEPVTCVEFNEKMSVSNFVNTNKFINNAKMQLNMWKIANIIKKILNQGVFFKSATSRRIGNYFCPPFGIPLVRKQSGPAEIVFMIHDICHHCIPDLVIGENVTIKHKNVYVFWRMMSECVTLILADMLYANTLVEVNKENKQFVDQRIYPLYEAIMENKANKWNDLETIKKLLWANITYGLLGDDTEWKKLFSNERISNNDYKEFDDYKNHFTKFFIGDHIWTNQNYQNMTNKNSLDQNKYLFEILGKDFLRKNNLILLDDMIEILEQENFDTQNIPQLVKYLFDYIFNKLFLEEKEEKEENLDIQLSKAFKRYIINQFYFYSKYRHFSNIKNRANIINDLIKSLDIIDKNMRTNILNNISQDINHLFCLNILTLDDAVNFNNIYPIFPAHYINYSDYKSKEIKDIINLYYNL